MNIKKIFYLAVFFIAAFTIYAETPQVRSSRPITDNEIDFIVETVGEGLVARITGYNGTKTEVRIPVQIRKMTIVAIGERAFYKKGFTSVTIPNGVILIGNEAFSENQITQITIGTNVIFNENSFDLKFAGFYLENGRRAGTYLFTDGKWAIQTIIDPPEEDIPVEAPKNAKKPGFFLEPFFNFSIGMGLWDCGPSSLVPQLGLYLGMTTKINNLTIVLAGEGGGFLGIAFPLFDDIGITYGFSFGSCLEFYFSGFIGFSLGGGMSKGYFTTKDKKGENYFFPFAELNVMLGDAEESLGVFFRYYFNDSSHFYNKFAVGIKKRGL